MSDDQGPPKVDHAAPFAAMVERIRKNADEKFGGSFVIVPPEGAGEPMELLALTTTDPSDFWLMLNAQIKKALEELQARTTNPYGQQRR